MELRRIARQSSEVESRSSPQYLSVLEGKKSPAYNNAYILLGVDLVGYERNYIKLAPVTWDRKLLLTPPTKHMLYVSANNMKIQAFIILILIFNNCFSQINSDFKIYSVIIEDYFLQHDSKRKHVDNAVIIDKLETETNWATESYDYIDYAFFDSPIDTLTKKKAKQMLSILKDSYSNNPTLIIDSFKCSVPLHLIKINDFKKLFNRNIEKGWDKFYKVYPRAIGAFGYTKIIYSDDMALLFVDFKRYGLAASGDVYIMKKIGEKWIIFNKFNMYKA